jgi:hypothetical protein
MNENHELFKSSNDTLSCFFLFLLYYFVVVSFWVDGNFAHEVSTIIYWEAHTLQGNIALWVRENVKIAV